MNKALPYFAIAVLGTFILCLEISIASANILSSFEIDSISVKIIRTGVQEGAYQKGKSMLLLRVFDNSTKSMVAEANLTDGYYGSSIYSRSKLEAIQEDSGTVLILFQARRGGDGDHTENTLYAYRYSNKHLQKVAEQNIFDTNLIYVNNTFSHIEGKTVLTFCSICDGWEVSAPEDIFIIPISLTLSNTSTVKCLLTDEEKRALITRFEESRESNIRKQLGYGLKRYKEYVSEISELFYSIVK